ncbi:MCE family protein [Nocardioides sp. WS12]|uniref:MCE family protein n=1 Tax=Nocardioides sp. WS12 TaxID=2486272 RepID=UPI0015FBA991|nr:MCE family protein [Nocardioides sp. WS12]
MIALLLSGCSWTGLNSVSLPFTKGGGDDNIEITVELENAANLVPNSEVKYDEVTIGSVRKIELKDWVATLTVGLEGDVKLPADVTASVAQKSLLGAEYLELKDPDAESTSAQVEYLASGDVIDRSRTGRYPETEEVLSAASLLLNGGGLPQLRTIAHELNNALGGRDQDVRSFMRTVSRFTSRLDRQRDNIASTLTQLNRLSRTVVNDRNKVDRFLEEVPGGLQALTEERRQLVRALRAVDDFGDVAHRVINGTKRDFQENLDNLAVITKSLAKHGDNLAKSVEALTYPFNTRAADQVVHGDYLNLITEIEVSPGNLTKYWLGGTPLDGLFPAIIEGAPTGPATDAGNPLSIDPLEGLLDGVGDVLGGLTQDKSGAKKSSSATSSGDDLLSNLLGPLLGGS